MRALLAVTLLLAATPAWAQKPPNDPSFRLRNDGRAPIVELFATPSGRANWGRSRLGRYPVPAGAVRLIHLPRNGNCVYDLQVIFAGGRHLTRRGTNLCRLTELHVP